MANVSVIIPTYNGLTLLKKHLASVIEAMRLDDELIIVDDASQDETLVYLSKKFKLILSNKENNKKANIDLYTGQDITGINVVVRHHKVNLRFAAGCNMAVNHAQHGLVFLLNNDVSVRKETIAKLVSTYQALSQNKSQVFAVGCLEYEGDTDKSSKAGKNVLYFDKGLFWHQKADNFNSGTTAWVSGGSGLFNKDLWQKLKGFDMHYYPAYWEDVDLSFRAKKMGYLVYFAAEAVVFHQHESTNLSYFSQSELAALSRNHQLYFTMKNGDIWQKIAYLLWQPYWLIFRIYHKYLNINDV